uniref:Helitron helicase-like domain-containing protein n=1 Tax=Glycine max TaxID=3847 RepID=A0A0R0FPU1_SOYBN
MLAYIDRIISVEIPDSIEQPQLYECVKKHMMHGPCDDYPIYKRRNDGKYIDRNGVALDNRYVVPYNPYLLLKYQAHLNIEWCHQSMFIKYLLKYINKGYDRITAALVPVENEDGTTEQSVNEIKHYLDGRYISPCEACWRIFSFQIHKRSPVVERLYFYLPGENSVIFEDSDDIDALLSKPIVKKSMFNSWLQANGIFQQAKHLTNLQFITNLHTLPLKMLKAM